MATDRTQKRILVVIPTSTLTQRHLLEGLLEYAHESATGAWQFHLDLHDLNRQHVRNLKSWGCNGIIAYILNDRARREFTASGLPAVFIEPTLAKPLPKQPHNVVTFINDHAAEGRTAARYFAGRRYRSFAYIGTAKPTFWSDERARGFAERLAEAGFAPPTGRSTKSQLPADSAVHRTSVSASRPPPARPRGTSASARQALGRTRSLTRRRKKKRTPIQTNTLSWAISHLGTVPANSISLPPN